MIQIPHPFEYAPKGFRWPWNPLFVTTVTEHPNGFRVESAVVKRRVGIKRWARYQWRALTRRAAP